MFFNELEKLVDTVIHITDQNFNEFGREELFFNMLNDLVQIKKKKRLEEIKFF